MKKGSDFSISTENIEKEFKSVLSLLKLSLYSLENIESLNDGELKEKSRKIFLKDFSFKVDDIFDDIIKNKSSKIPLINIIEFLYFTSPEKEVELIFWMNNALRFFEKYDPTGIDRCLINLALFCKNSSRVYTITKYIINII